MLVFLIATFCTHGVCEERTINYPDLNMMQCAVHGQLIALEWQKSNMPNFWQLKSYTCSAGSSHERKA